VGSRKQPARKKNREPLGVADVKRRGSDVTVVAVGWMVKKALASAERLAPEGDASIA